MRSNKLVYFVYVVRREGGVIHVLKRFRFKNPKTSVRWGRRSFVVRYDSPTYAWGLRRYYLLDERSGAQYSLHAAGEDRDAEPMTPEELDVILGTKIVREITSSVGKDLVEMVVPVLLGALAGFLAAWIICSMVYQGKIDEIVRSLTENTIPFNPFNPTQSSLVFFQGLPAPWWVGVLAGVVPGA